MLNQTSLSAFALVITLLGPSAPIFASLAATAEITTAQTSAPFSYTITLHNTGDTDIGTFWFAWTNSPADYDFLPSFPTNVQGPSGWFTPVTHNPNFPSDGYGIEWYNYFGSALGPGQSSSAFTFTSTDSPQQLAGNAWFPGFKVTNSFVYIGFPESDPGFQFVVSVPEPAGAMGGFLLAPLLMRRRDSVR